MLESVREPGDVELVARKIVEAIRAPFQIAGLANTVTTSCGAVFVRPSRDTDLEALNKIADEALYAAKGAGRNRYFLVLAQQPASIINESN